MSFTLSEVDAEQDFEELIAAEWESYEKPLQTFFRLFAPIRGEGSSARQESLDECTERQHEWHRADPTSYWQKVMDEDGKIVGGALWKICDKNPFEHDEEETAYWYPKGGQRDFVNGALEIFEAPRKRMGQRPQVYLNIIFTLPSHRRQGIADIMLEWGKRKADSLGVEMWLDATSYGIPLYKKHGFVVVHENVMHPKSESANADWKKLEAELVPMVMWQMWRPIGRDFEEGKTSFPWV